MGNNIPQRWLDQHNAKVAAQMAEHRIEAWIRKELGGDNDPI